MRFRLSQEALELSEAIASVAGPDAGAMDIFIGSVRDSARGRRVLRLEYEGYEAMVLAQFELYAREVAELWPGARLSIHHRLGACEAGEPTVYVVAACAHRAEAFAACRHAIERLKADTPIWKREVYDDGGEWIGQGS